MQIIHIRNKDIDFERWDEVIAHSTNQLGYAFSWYLDIVSPGWEALIGNDYEYVMPLPVKKKFGINYLVQPMLTQQLGVFSPFKLDESTVTQFIKHIPYYSYEINLNESNFSSDFTELPNYVINLNNSYDNLLKRFSKNTLRNIEKATKSNLSIVENLTIDEFVNFNDAVEKNYISTNSTLLRFLLNKGIEKKVMNLVGILNEQNKIIAVLCLLRTTNRIIYLFPLSNAEGKKLNAMFLLVDSIIKKNAGATLFLDFEGSTIEGIARFYKGFGAINQPYYNLKRFRPSFLIGKISSI